MTDRLLQADVVIVGAGVMGASLAYWLSTMQPGIDILLIERDPTYMRASSALSASSIRQQFSSPINIELSRFGFTFLRNADRLLALDGQGPDLALEERGYLYLGREADLPHMTSLNTRQRACGAPVALLEPAELARRFPWLNVTDLAAGSLGLAQEGWFDGYALMQALLRKARAQGARILHAEVGAVVRQGDRIERVLCTNGVRVNCGSLVNAAGPWAGRLADLAGTPLPVHARRRTVFVFSCPVTLTDCPLVIDCSGFWFRPEGKRFIGGVDPDPDSDDLPLEPNHAEFSEDLWATLAERVPAFEALRIERAWAGYYDMNVFDQNALIGPAPGCTNLFCLNGFSGHGMQHAVGAARGLAEWMLLGHFESIDLSALGVGRIARGQRFVETQIIG